MTINELLQLVLQLISVVTDIIDLVLSHRKK